MNNSYYLCIDLKSFYASVECILRGLDPMTTNLVVADPERSDRTICLAVSPSLKEQGVKNRCRVFQIPDDLDYIMAPPQMQKYIDCSADIYEIYLKYFDKEDIYIYSIDEVFINITPYLNLYKTTPLELGKFLIQEIKEETGVPATCGIGTNLYLAKVALDITAKHSENFIGYLTEDKYKEELWEHTPLTDFWRIGRGIQNRLNEIGLFTMKDIATADEEIIYNLIGKDAELLIDHSKGIEPVTLKEIKNYHSKKHSIGAGQVLMRDYTFDEAKVIVQEMTENLVYDLIRKNLTTNSVHLRIRYSRAYDIDPSRGTIHLNTFSNSESLIEEKVLDLYDEITLRDLKIRKITLTFNNVQEEKQNIQLNFFDQIAKKKDETNSELNKILVGIKQKFGSNAVLKGHDLYDEATTIERNNQIGGHRSGNEKK